MNKKRTGRCISVLIILTVLAAVVAFPFLSAAAFNNEVKKGTVPVVFYVRNAAFYLDINGRYRYVQDIGDSEFTSGSGFFIGGANEANPKHVFTNCHVIEDYVEASKNGNSYIYTGQIYEGYPVCVKAESCELRVYYTETDYDLAEVECYGSTDSDDLAVITLRQPTTKRHALQLMATNEDMVGETVFTVGYPGNADNPFTNASKYGVNDATVHKGIINKFVSNSETGIERIAIDATIQHGNSGGPLVTEEGYVIGVNTNVWSTSPYENQIEADYYAISSKEIMKFLNKHGIAYQLVDEKGELQSQPSQPESEPESSAQPSQAPESRPDPSSVPPQSSVPAGSRPESEKATSVDMALIIIIVAVSIFVIAGVVVTVILVSVKGRKPAPSPASPARPVTPAAQANPAVPTVPAYSASNQSAYGTTPIYGGVQGYGSSPAYGVNQGYGGSSAYGTAQGYGGSPTYGGAQGYGTAPGYGNAQQSVYSSAAGYNAAPATRGIMRSSSPQHRGMTFTIGKEPVMIGRDKTSCKVVFDNGTPGISGKHCTISYDPATQEFTLTDLRSSYGTYLVSTGRKLDPHEPVKLKSGESFCLAAKSYMMTVEVQNQ